MSDSNRRPDEGDPDPNDLDLTHNIRRLTLPVSPEDAVDGQIEQKQSVLLVSRDTESGKWGPRWLRQAGFDTNLLTDPKKALDFAIATSPDAVIVDAGLCSRKGVPLFIDLQQSDQIDAPVIVLSASTKETAATLRARVDDIVRKPFDWELVSQRTIRAIELKRVSKELADSRSSLSKALVVADSARQQLRSRETTEPVTGLPNKSTFIELLRRGMAAVERDNNILAVFVIGFNRFRLVIEAMGQEQADLIMTEIGKKLSECLRKAEFTHAHSTGLRTAAAASIDLARFGLMLTCSSEDDAVRDLQRQIVEELSSPFQIAGQTVYLSACVGVALYPQDASDVDRLLQRADNAMRDAQARGGGFRFYCKETDAAAARKLKLENMLHDALGRKELSVVYQPIVNTRDNQIAAAEALLRWKQPDGSYISPDEFVPIAEESGLMIRIGKFVLDEAFRQLKTWRDENILLPLMCVNVAKAQLMSGGFVDTVSQLLCKYDVNPENLEIELSERGVLSGDFGVIDQLHDLRDLGVRLSIDDFGTGDSAIAYLKELPVHTLKIDRSYIDGLTKNSKDTAIIAAMIALGHRLNLNVIAEGVETEEQVSMLKDLGCDEFQGFYVSRAVPVGEFVSFIGQPESLRILRVAQA